MQVCIFCSAGPALRCQCQLSSNVRPHFFKIWEALPVKKSVLLPLCFVALTTAQHAQSQQQADGAESLQPACLTSASNPVFKDFERLGETWATNYEVRKSEFRTHVLENSNLISRCAEKALRRDLTKNSRTTFGVHVSQSGRVIEVAMLRANHSDNLYAACLTRILCTFEINPVSQGVDEILLFNFNLNRRPRPHERPWEIESQVRGDEA